MKISMETPGNLRASEIETINTLAGLGFGQNAADMLDDTRQHIEGADYVQQAHEDGETVGFALYRRCLWR